MSWDKNNTICQICNCTKYNKEVEAEKKQKLIAKEEETSHSNTRVVPELPIEIWVEFLRKLPIKRLHICKCVSKTWNSHVSHILNRQKGLELPPIGLLFDIVVQERKFSLGYLSLPDGKFSRWSLDHDNDDDESPAKSEMIEVIDHYDYDESPKSGLSLGNLTIDFSTLISHAKYFRCWMVHRGIVLIMSNPLRYVVHNPATKQSLFLPRPPSLDACEHRDYKSVPREYSTIINLSDCVLSTQCDFRVVRLKKREMMRLVAEVYSSKKRRWVLSECKFGLEKEVFAAQWCKDTAVFLDNINTLFFLTSSSYVVGIKFRDDSSCEQVSLIYSLQLPPGNSKGFIGSCLFGSQGCLYLILGKFPDLCIWKHNGSSMEVEADAWIPQLLFTKTGTSNLCRPVTEKHLRQSVSVNHNFMKPIIVHPQAPVVFIYDDKSIFAFNLLNDMFEKIADLKIQGVIAASRAFVYSPCFASFECLKQANQARSS